MWYVYADGLIAYGSVKPPMPRYLKVFSTYEKAEQWLRQRQ